MTILALLEWQGGQAFPKISEAMDGRSEAHLDVLVAFFGKQSHTGAAPKTLRLPDTNS